MCIWENTVISSDKHKTIFMKKFVFFLNYKVSKITKTAFFQLYGTSYSQSPQIFPQASTSDFMSNFEKFCQTRKKHNFSSHFYWFLTDVGLKKLEQNAGFLLRKRKMQEQWSVPAF